MLIFCSNASICGDLGYDISCLFFSRNFDKISVKYLSRLKPRKIDAFKQKLDVDPRQDDDASPEVVF